METKKKRMTKKKILLYVLPFLLLLFLVNRIWYLYHKYAIGTVGKSIMQEVENCADENGACTIDLTDITDFEWDTLFVYDKFFPIDCDAYKSDPDYADVTMSEMMGISYERAKGSRAHLIFLNDGELVHDESYLADMNDAAKFNVSIISEYRMEKYSSCCKISADSAEITVSYDGEHYYLYF